MSTILDKILAALDRLTKAYHLDDEVRFPPDAGEQMLPISFLRQLINWGANPALLTGTEYQQERLDLARGRSPAALQWHLGDLDVIPDGSIDLVVLPHALEIRKDDGVYARLQYDTITVNDSAALEIFDIPDDVIAQADEVPAECGVMQ